MNPAVRATLAVTGGGTALYALAFLASRIGHDEPYPIVPFVTAAALASLGVLAGMSPDRLRAPTRAAGRVLLAGTASAAVLGCGALLVAALVQIGLPLAALLVALAYLGAAAAIRSGLLAAEPARTARRAAWSVERTPPPLTAVLPRVSDAPRYGLPAGVTYTGARGVA